MAKTKTQENTTQAATPETTYPPMHLDVRINRINPTGYVRANASVTLNGCFGVKNIKIMDGSKGIYVAMPSYTVQSSGEWREHCFPVTKEFREQLHSEVLDAYHQALNMSHESAMQGAPQPEYEPMTAPYEEMDEPEEPEPEHSYEPAMSSAQQM